MTYSSQQNISFCHKIPQKILYGSVSVQGWPLNTGSLYKGSTVFRTDIYNDMESGDVFCTGRLKRGNDFSQEPIIRSEQLPYLAYVTAF